MIFRILKKIFNKIYYLYYKNFVYDFDEIYKNELSKMKILGFDENKSIQKLNAALHSNKSSTYNSLNDSVHWKLFSALSVIMDKKKIRILEIGTYDGNFTKIISNLFKNSEIVSVDLPIDDPILTETYNRENSESLKIFLNTQKNNTSSKNITLIKTNTLFLMDKLNKKEKFDIIWVDGGHLFPEVAWDICQCFHLLNNGGYMLCDDVIKSNGNYKTKYVSTESFKVLKYLDERYSSKNTFFLKRLNPKSLSNKFLKKYVSIIKK